MIITLINTMKFSKQLLDLVRIQETAILSECVHFAAPMQHNVPSLILLYLGGDIKITQPLLFFPT